MNIPRTATTLLGILTVLLAGCTGSGRKTGDSAPGSAFASPEVAVPAIDEMLRKEDWKGLAAYYDLEGSGVNRRDLESGKFFTRTERPADAHPGIPWKIRHPFPPGYRFQSATPTADASVVEVTVMIEIDQGGGPKQRGLSSFRMRRSAAGYRILPP